MGTSLSQVSAPKVLQKITAKLCTKSNQYGSRLIVDAFVRDSQRSGYCAEDINSLIHSYYRLIHRATIKYDTNKLYVDVIEQFNASYSSNGTLLSSNIIGLIQIQSHLSGIPRIEMSIDLSETYKSDELVLSYHECVDNHYKYKDKLMMEFIPLDMKLDGPFNVLTYDMQLGINNRLLTVNNRPLIMVEYVEINRDEDSVEFKITATSDYKRHIHANNVEIFIPVDPNVHLARFSQKTPGGHGKIEYPANNGCIKWSMQHFSGQSKYEVTSRFTLLPATTIKDHQSHDTIHKFTNSQIRVRFEMPNYVITGIYVKCEKLENLFVDTDTDNYASDPCMNYVILAGDYTIQM